MFNPQTKNQRLLAAQVRAYVVQRGDTLSEIGFRLGLPWRDLARSNKLRNPHLLHPGQLILLPEVV